MFEFRPDLIDEDDDEAADTQFVSDDENDEENDDKVTPRLGVRFVTEILLRNAFL